MMTSLLMLLSLFAVQAQGGLRPDPPIACDACDEWNARREPVRIFGNTYYVGTAGVSSVLIASDKGLILLDGALPQSAALIDANIRALGFRTEDVRLIVNSHAHFDHAGGIAALQRASGATVAASAAGARALEQGAPSADDPQANSGRNVPFPPVRNVRTVADGEIQRVGDLAITAHLTPGHTPGGTTWTWRSCEGDRCLDMVYADSLTAVSDPEYRFTGNGTTPGTVDAFRRSIAKVAQLPCDVIVSVHPNATNLDGRLKRRTEMKPNGPDPLIDPNGCRAYAAGAAKRLEVRVAEEKGASR